jgi:hypothetical protein
MARTPEQNRAIYERRKARAIEQGYKGYSGRGGARQERQALRVKPTDVTAQPRRVVDTPAGRLTRTPAQRHVLAAVRDAAAQGQRVSIQVTFRTPYGQWRTRDLSKRWYSVVEAATRSTSKTRRGGGRPTDAGPSPSKPVQVRAGQIEGPLADDWLALFDDYDDLWDALYDAWEEEGSG